MLLTQIEHDLFTPEYTPQLLRDLKAAKVDTVLISLCEFFEEGEERKKVLEELRHTVRLLEEQGFRTAVWTNTLGWGGVRTSEVYRKRFGHSTPLTSFEGDTGGAVCTLDADFRKAMADNVRDFVRAGARTVLLDDDLVQSVRPGALCTCPLHLKRFAERTGRSWTREEVRNLFTGSPSPERSAYLDLMGESMTDFCRALREAAEEADPKVILGLCASYTHYDLEGVGMRDLIRLLAGKGNRPFFRLSGATYWPVLWNRFPSYRLGDVLEFVRMQIAWFRREDWDFFDENDPYPRRQSIVPASYVELYDKIVLANGGVGRHKYMMCYDERGPVRGERAYLEAHLRDMPYDEELTGMFAGKTPEGWYVRSDEHALRKIDLPSSYPGDAAFMTAASQPLGGIFLSRFCLPTRYDGSGAGILCGYHAQLLPENELGRGWLLDSEAAGVLTERGIDVGVRRDGSGTLCPGEGAVRLGTEKKLGLWGYTNAEGQRFVFLDRNLRETCLTDISALPDSPEAQDQLASAYRYLSGRDLPALLRIHPGAYTVVSLNEEKDRMSILLCNIDPDAIEEPVFRLDGKWRVLRTLKQPAQVIGGELRMSRLEAYGFDAVELSRA